MSYIIPLSELSAADAPTYGGKAAMLGELNKLKNSLSIPVEVPEGWAIHSDAYVEWMNAVGIKDERMTQTLDTIGKDVAKLEELSAIITAKAQDVAINKSLKAEIEKLVSNKNQYAVRSSGIGEDGNSHSFAGQHDTYLNTWAELVPAHVSRVWLSAFHPRALYYRVARGLTASPIRQGVVIQEMVQPTFAGVAMSADPKTGSTENGVIEYVQGLGESLVSGKTTPKVINFNHDTGAKTSVEWALNLIKVVLELKAILNYHVDLEWAVRDGKLYLLQVRPITALPVAYTSQQMKMIELVHDKYGTPIMLGEVLSEGQTTAIGFVRRGQIKRVFGGLDHNIDLTQRVMAVPFTTPDDVPAMEQVRAIVVSKGGMTSHAAIVSRELGKPCLRIGTLKGLTPKRQGLYIDGQNGGIYNVPDWWDITPPEFGEPFEPVKEEKIEQAIEVS